jgi:predicted RNA methylase
MIKIKHWAGEINKMGMLRFFKEKYFGRHYKTSLQKSGTCYPDLTKNVHSTIEESVYKDSKMNQPASYYSLHKAFSKLPIEPKDICFLDIGCGAGRALNFAMLLGCKEVSGVELDEKSVELSIQNCTLMQQQGFHVPFSVFRQDAVLYKIPQWINTVYLFNPFGKKTLEAVLQNIITASTQYKQPVYIIYTEALFRQVFDNNPLIDIVYESHFRQKGLYDLVIYKTKES